ncbi:DUF1642 domain-containing protein [Enterococcus dongliensis]|uniref:DUF1642 domain-containing protein n=1 Tax=Enterococcus dongliensis TaxID=2559925 RepID=UPI00288E1EEC|nr:DUF1642 domain-containing protein [Enterococcus dongliensis]MDT2640658.1 DUF1642 domain-containing protein [Enterococcus dongliensis]
MNKQEVIDKLKEYGAWCTECHDINEKKDRYVKAAKVRELLEQLDEPQKVKVPAYVAEWIELCKEKADLSSCLNGYYEIGDGTIVRPRGFSEEFYDWLSDYDHMHDLARAYLDGYEVEKESKWVVNEGDLVIRKGEHESKVYFVEIVDDDGILLVNGIKDEFFTDLDERSVGEESINYFYENFRLLAKKENLEVEKV